MNFQVRINSWLFPAVSWLSGLLAVLMLTGAPIRWLGLLESQFGADWLVPVAWLGTFALASIVLVGAFIRQPIVLAHVVKSPLYWLLFSGVCWALLTAIWSVDQSVTIRLWVVLAGTALIAVVFANVYTVHGFLLLLVVSVAIIFVGSVILNSWDPELATHSGGTHDGRWMGLLTHKNHLGNLAALGLVFSAIYVFWTVPNTLSWLASVLVASLSAVILVFAESATAVLVAIAGLTVLMFCLLRKQFSIAPYWYLVAIGLALLGLLVFKDVIFDFLGRGSTLTGRVHIWKILLVEIKLRPIAGFGYEAYWSNPNVHSVSLPDGLRGSHNGFIKIWLEQGLTGVGIVIVTYGWAIRVFVSRFWKRQIELRTVLSGVLLAMVFVNNLGENTLTQAGSIFHALWVYAVLLLAFPYDGEVSSRSGKQPHAGTGVSS